MKKLGNVAVTVITSIVVTILMFMFLNASFKDVKPFVDEAEVGQVVGQVDVSFRQATLLVTHEYVEPAIDVTSKQSFILSMNACISYLYHDTPEAEKLPRELIIAQAILESNYGKSRLAEVRNNLFGIRTWDADVPHVFPLGIESWPGWGVRAYSTKCESVKDYLRIINEVWAYAELRQVRAENPNADGIVLAQYLDKFSTNPDYGNLVIKIIKKDLRVWSHS